MHSRKLRETPIAYTEVHHILPRSLGGSDHEYNLVRLEYREHFIAHWLLTKFLSGKALRKMQFALHAMTLPISGQRIVAGWQFEVAKRALVTEEMIIAAEAKARAEHVKRNCAAVAVVNKERLKAALEDMKIQVPLVSKWAPVVRFKKRQKAACEVAPASEISLVEEPRKRRPRKPRPSKRVRRRLNALRFGLLSSPPS